jgi:hypothetical protein
MMAAADLKELAAHDGSRIEVHHRYMHWGDRLDRVQRVNA